MTLTKTTKTILFAFLFAALFAALIAAMILPFSMTDLAFVESRDDKIERLGNEGKKTKENIDIEKDPVKKNQLKDDLEELKSQMRAIGIPTVAEYEADKEYWRDIAVQHHLNELDRIEKASKKDGISFTEFFGYNLHLILPAIIVLVIIIVIIYYLKKIRKI